MKPIELPPNRSKKKWQSMYGEYYKERYARSCVRSLDEQVELIRWFISRWDVEPLKEVAERVLSPRQYEPDISSGPNSLADMCPKNVSRLPSVEGI